MLERLMLTVVAGTCMAAVTLAQHAMQMEPPAPEKIEVPEAGVTMPMLDLGGRPMVDVMLNGKGPYPFILDTGASIIAVNEDLQSELGLPPAANAPPGVARVEKMSLGGAVLYGVVVMPGPRMRGLSGENPPRGILGAAFFPGYLLSLDYPRKKVTIRRGALPPADNRRVFQYAVADILPRVPVRIAGHEYRPHVDSGSPGGVTLPVNTSGDLPLTEKPVEVGRARTPGGEFPVLASEVTVPIELGEWKLETRQIEFSDVRPGSEPPVGNLGFRVLRNFVIALDAKNRRVEFVR
jgi:hypothetical protein